MMRCSNLGCFAAVVLLGSGCQQILGIEDVVEREETPDASGGTGPGEDDGGADTGPSVDIDWVELEGGTFFMGSDDEDASVDEIPVREVTLSAFELAQTETTVAQYEACVDAGECEEPGTFSACNWGVSDRADHPINCVSWHDATDFCEFAGGRLPTEAEREYAARSGGRDWKYLWGNEDATCDRAVMNQDSGTEGRGCGEGATWPVCSKPAGDSEQGICDLAGNVWEWVDNWYGDYPSEPQVDPTGPESGSSRVVRGGSWLSGVRNLGASNRGNVGPSGILGALGFRCARSP